MNYEFGVQILPIGTDDRAILEIFARLNSSGLKLNSQELRNASYFGDFKTTMYGLAYEQLTRWRTWKVFTEQSIARMEEVEATSELAEYILRGMMGKSQKRLDALYNDNDERFEQTDLVMQRYRQVMDAIDDLLGQDINTLVFSRRALFYVIFAVFFDALFVTHDDAGQKRPKALSKNFASGILLASERLRNIEELPSHIASAIRGAPTDLKSRHAIYGFVRQAIEDA